MTRLFKTLAIIGVLLCFILGAFALSFAAHDSPSWPRLTVELQRVPPGGVARLTQYAVRFGLRSEAGEVPCSTRPHLEEIHLAGTELAEPIHVPPVARIHAPKVSLQILDSFYYFDPAFLILSPLPGFIDTLSIATSYIRV